MFKFIDWSLWTIVSLGGLTAGLSWLSRDYACLYGLFVGVGVGLGYIVGRLREKEEWR